MQGTRRQMMASAERYLWRLGRRQHQPGGSEPQSGDGYEPAGIALVSTLTPGS